MGQKSKRRELEKCKGCVEHIQYLTPETYRTVMDFILDYKEQHPEENKLSKNRAVNKIIAEWKEK